MPGTSHIEVSSYPSQQEIRNFNTGRYVTKRISKCMVVRAIVQHTAFKLHVCRMVLTYMLGMAIGFDVIADTHSLTHNTFVCTDTKLISGCRHLLAASLKCTMTPISLDEPNLAYLGCAHQQPSSLEGYF